MKKTFKLEDLDCANCAAKMERTVQETDGVISAAVNFLAQKLVVEIADDQFDTVFKTVKKRLKKSNPDVTILD